MSVTASVLTRKAHTAVLSSSSGRCAPEMPASPHAQTHEKNIHQGKRTRATITTGKGQYKMGVSSVLDNVGEAAQHLFRRMCRVLSARLMSIPIYRNTLARAGCPDIKTSTTKNLRGDLAPLTTSKMSHSIFLVTRQSTEPNIRINNCFVGALKHPAQRLTLRMTTSFQNRRMFSLPYMCWVFRSRVIPLSALPLTAALTGCAACSGV